jgi:hypothetical protein
VAPKIVLVLSIVEAKRVLRHPVLLAGVAFSAWLSIRPWLGGEPVTDYETQNYETFLIYWAPLYFAAFIVANTAALRERETTTAEMFRSAPARYSERTLALLAAGLVPATLAAILAAIHRSVIAHAGGITVGNQFVRLTPTVVEMALVPATAAAAFASGVALARTVRSRTFGAILAAVATYMFFLMFWAFNWFPGYFLAPYATSLHTVDLGQQLTTSELTRAHMLSAPSYYEADWQVLVRDIHLVGWHNVYLLGLALLLSAYAVWRSGQDRRVRWLLLAGAILTIGGLVLHMAAFGSPFDWWQTLPGLV